jgi:hypothetical protein
MKVTVRNFPAALGLLALAACSDSTSSSTGQLVVQLTDAQTGAFASAKVWISSVYVVPGADSTGPRYVIAETPQEYDLLNLKNGVLATLGTAALPVGDYQQLRIVVDSARVTLADPVTFSGGDADATLRVPSGQQTGIKVVFASTPIHVSTTRATVVVDFDVARNFLLTGPPASPTGALFRPVLHGVSSDVASSIAGVVAPANATATVYALAGTDTVQGAEADTLTGAYTLRFLPPGAYTLLASGINLSITKSITLRAGQDTTGVNFP